MNRYFIIVICLYLFIGCNSSQRNDEKSASIIADKIKSVAVKDTTEKRVSIDLDKSVIYWKGTKLTGKHEGTAKFSKGTLTYNEKDKLNGGDVTVNMKTINITDIPKHEPVPRRNLMNHFTDEFEIDRFLTSSFSFNQVNYLSPSEMEIIGNLEIKGINRSIKITAVNKNDQYVSEFSFNRFDWGIGEDGSWFAKKFVDEEIQLKVVLVPVISVN